MTPGMSRGWFGFFFSFNLGWIVAGIAGVAITPGFASPPARLAGSAPPAADDAFSIVALPDTQYYASSYPRIFRNQTRWIAKNAEKLRIKFVVGLGDIVDDGASVAQWRVADRAYRELDGKVPYLATIGNHDYDEKGRIATSGRKASRFNRFFGPSRYLSQGYSWYRQGPDPKSNENFYALFQIQGASYLVLSLEFYPRDSVIEWASGLIAANPGSQVIIATHSYLNNDNTRVSPCDPFAKAVYGLKSDNNGDDLWRKLVSKHPNVVLVLSGHIPVDGVGRRVDLGEGGNLVNQVLSDYQGEPSGGGGFLRVMTFHPSRRRIDVRTYSPELKSERSDPRNRFSLDLGIPSGAFPSFFEGVVKTVLPGGKCVGVPGAVATTSFGSAVTDERGRFKLKSPASSPVASVPYSVRKDGFREEADRATLSTPRGSSVTEVYLAH